MSLNSPRQKKNKKEVMQPKPEERPIQQEAKSQEVQTNQEVVQPKSEETFESLKASAEKIFVEYLHSVQTIDVNINEIRQEIEKLKGLISQIQELRNVNRQEIEELKQKISNEPTKIKDYKKRVGELGSEVDKVIKNYKNVVKSLHPNVIRPYRKLLNTMEELKKRANSISEELKNYTQKIEYHKNLAKKVVERPVILSILEKYTAHSGTIEEAKKVMELLYENPENLRAAIEIGKQLNYSDCELMPIIAAYELKFYTRGEPNKQKCEELSISTQEIDRYISHLIVQTKDNKIRDELMTEAYKLSLPTF